MSTYTDLHNRVKENVTVDYNNRITTQRVRLFNEQNEYWGTLRGHVSAENINIVGGNLSGITLQDTILKGSVALPDGINLHNMLKQVEQLSIDLEQVDANLNTEIASRKDAIAKESGLRLSADDAEQSLRIANVTSLKRDIEQTNTDFKRELSTLDIVLKHRDDDISSALSNTVDVRIADEAAIRAEADDKLANNIIFLSTVGDYLSDEIDTTNLNLRGEIIDRVTADKKLELSIDTEAKNSIARDTEISNKLEQHILDNEEQFDYAHREMLSTVEHNRHYTINYINGTVKLTDTWPFGCKDFAVNIYKPTVNDGAVYYTDPNGDNYNIGQIYKLTNEGLYPFTFKTLNGIKHDGVASSLIDNWSYGFAIDKKSQGTEINGYSITFNDTASSHELSDYNFTISPILPQYHKLWYGSLLVGKVTDAYPADNCDDIVSGKIWIDTQDTQLETFNKYRKTVFNKTDLSTLPRETERVEYVGENKFYLYKNLIRNKYVGIYDNTVPNTRFGMIYESYENINGISSDDDGLAYINVYTTDPNYKLVSLTRENGFRNNIESNVKFGETYYDLVLSAAVDGLSATFDEVKVSELYKYNFSTIKDDGTSCIGGYVVPKKYNKTLLESKDFNEVDINIADIMWIEAFKKTFTLTKVPNETSLWSAEEIDDNGNVITLHFNGEQVKIAVIDKENEEKSSVVVRSYHTVDFNNPTIFNPETCHKHIYKSATIKLDYYNEVEEQSDPALPYELTIDSTATTESFPTYELDLDLSQTNKFQIEIPDRTTLDIAREFMVVIKPDCEVDRLIKLEFVHTDGKVATICSNRRDMILVPTNKWTTLQVKEINHNIFYVLDLDGNENDHDIEFLSNAIDVEETNRLSDDKFLSDTIEISVNNLQEQVISNDNDIDYLSGELDFVLSVDRESMTYKGTLPYLLNEQDPISHEDLGYTYLSSFILQTNAIHADGRVKLGDFFKLSAIQSCLYDASVPPKSIWLGSNDYFVINKDKMISDLVIEDLDIFRNAQSEVEWLSTSLCADIDKLSTDLSTEISALDLRVNNTIEFKTEDLQNQIISNDNDIEFLSAQHDWLSDELSADIDKLSTDLSTNIDSICASISNTVILSVNNLQDQVISNDEDITYLSNNVKFLLSVDKETMNYKGTLPQIANIIDASSKDLGYNFLSAFIAQNIGTNQQGLLKHGDFFKISAIQSCLLDANIPPVSVYFGSNDYFVVNKDCTLSNIKAEDIDIFHDAESEVVKLSNTLSNVITLSVTDLQNQIISNDNDIEFLSSQHDWLSDELSNVIILSTKNLQDQVISNDNDIDYLSTTLDFTLSSGKYAVEYKGTVPEYIPVAPLTADYNLSAFLKPMVTDKNGFIKQGFLYRLSAEQPTLSDYNEKTIYLGAKDFFIVNKDTNLSSITFDDIDIFRNAEKEVEWLSAELSTVTKLSVANLQEQVISNDEDIKFLSSQHDWLSTQLSDTMVLSVANLQEQVISNDEDIEFLSVQHDWLSIELSTDIDNLSTALSLDIDKLSTDLSTNIDSICASISDTVILSVNNLQDQVISNDEDIKFLSAEISSNDEDIKFLSNDLSTLEYQHYNKTLSNNISVDHKYYDADSHEHTITHVVDQLIILDEVTFDRYRLTIRNGSLNINKIDNVVPTV